MVVNAAPAKKRGKFAKPQDFMLVSKAGKKLQDTQSALAWFRAVGKRKGQ